MGGIIGNASNAGLQTKIAAVEERANIIYADKQMQKIKEGLGIANKPTMQEIVNELENENYEIEQKMATGIEITDIKLDKESMKIAFGGTKTIQVTLVGNNGNDAYTYYVLIDGKYYKMNFNNGNITVDREESQIQKGGSETGTKELTATSSDETKATVSVDKTNNTVNVTANNIAGTNIVIKVSYGTISKECIVEVKEMETVAPNVAKIELCTELTNLDEAVDAKITHEDDENGSGIDITNCKWIYTTNANEIGIDSNEWNLKNANTFTTNEETIELTKSEEGTYYLHVLSVDNDENKKETISEGIKVEDITKNWDTTKVDIKTSNDGIKVPVPKGFTMSTVDGETKVETGLVIKEGTNGAAESGINEFVWVPVHCNRQMFEVVNGQNVGILYNFSGNTSTRIAYPTPANSGAREPDILTDTNYGDASTTTGRGVTQLTSIVGITGENNNVILENWKTQLQNEFDEMKASVEKYKGFYIGRYETGNLKETKAVVKKGNTDIGSQNWYVQYQKSKEIVTSTNTKTSMIWGCQWDATLRWFQKSKDVNVVKFVTDSTGKGNYAGTQGSINKIIGTGSNDAFKVNNIYDMAGNVRDWTMMAGSNQDRYGRRRKVFEYRNWLSCVKLQS